MSLSRGIFADRFHVGSDVGKLCKTLLHRSELSLKRLTPNNCQSLLFDDVLRIGQIGKEYDAFQKGLTDNSMLWCITGQRSVILFAVPG